MKHLYTPFFIFFCTTFVTAQVTDTLFTKNFNDKSLTSSPSNTSVSFSGSLLKLISSPTDTSYKIDGTTSLAINPYASLYSQLIANNTTALYKLFNISINNTGTQDSLLIGFSIKTKSFAGDLLNPINRSATISAPFSAPVSLLLNYVSDGAVSLQKTYALYPSELLNVNHSSAFFLNATKSISSGVPQVADVMIRTKNNSGSSFNYNFSVTRPSTSSTLIVPNSGSSFTATDADFKTALLNNFCSSAANPALCKAFYTLTYLFGSFTEDYNFNSFVIDNLFVGGYNQLPLGIVNNEQQKKESYVVKAYNIMGLEITDYYSYTGLAIVNYSDGRKAKVLK